MRYTNQRKDRNQDTGRPSLTHRAMDAAPLKRLQILAACDKLQAAQEFRAQHGKVRVLMRNGEPGPDAP